MFANCFARIHVLLFPRCCERYLRTTLFTPFFVSPILEECFLFFDKWDSKISQEQAKHVSLDNLTSIHCSGDSFL